MKKSDVAIINMLESEVNDALDRIGELDDLLTVNVKNLTKHEHLVTAAYHLSGIYSCWEDIFFKIAKVFENRVENPSSWHKELLDRMRIAVKDIRPRVISDSTYVVLDEMRRFRHVFRSSYMFSLKRPQIELLIKQWNDAKNDVKKDIKLFFKLIS